MIPPKIEQDQSNVKFKKARLTAKFKLKPEFTRQIDNTLSLIPKPPKLIGKDENNATKQYIKTKFCKIKFSFKEFIKK